MADIDLGVFSGTVSHVGDSNYYQLLLDLIDNARNVLCCSIFIVNADPSYDPQLLVYTVLRKLQSAVWRGVHVQLLIAGSRTNLEIALVTKVSADLAADMGIPVRWLSSQDVRGSHSKFVVADDQVLIGSHNWSDGAFSNQIQDSVLIKNGGLAAYFLSIFREQWERTELVAE